ncbi:MAG: hypothetical protein EOO38_26950 [Cytophagaceae bacterium]|nr:MAG: hypothetical protein EOO38_26950 [Cytophagaceae bacterium]
MAFEPAELIAAIKSTGIPGAMAFAGIYTGTTASNWMPAFQEPVSIAGLSLLSCSGLWFFGIFVGRLTGLRALTRLEGKDASSVPELPDASATTAPAITAS